MNFEVPTLLLFTAIYSIYLKKENNSYIIICLFLLTISTKLFFIYLETFDYYINSFTIRDESTFIEAVLIENQLNNINIFAISPGDYFLFYILDFFYSIFKSILSIKLVPVFFSIITFHYALKIGKLLKYSYNYIFFMLLLLFFWPSNFLFHYSPIKEFLQLTFVIVMIYYSLKLLNKQSITIVCKYLIILSLFSYAHRGFELVSLISVLSIFILILSQKVNFDFFKIITKIWCRCHT